MKVVIELHEAFRNNYEEDKFEDSLRRLYDDMVANCLNDDYSASGNYELELLHELLRVFPKSHQIDDKSGEWIEAPDPHGFFVAIPICSECGSSNRLRQTYKYCPNCGAKMDGKENE